MKKPAYGLQDASRKFFLKLCAVLIELGCKQSIFDPAVYLYYDKNKHLDGLVLTHVDDLMHGSGGNAFCTNVMKPLKETFKFGSEDKFEFRYVGMNVKQCKQSIHVNQNHYISSIELPLPRNEKDDEIFDYEGQSEFRSLLGRIGWLGNHSRPDLVYDHMAMSTKLGKATGSDFEYALKIARKMIASTTEMKFPKLGDLNNWVIEAFADAGFRSLPDQVSSCGGQVILVRDTNTNNACVMGWKGKKLKRIVTSSTAAETLASNQVISEIIFVKALLGEFYGPDASNIKVNLYTDSNNLYNAVHSTSMVEDPRSRTEIASLKESLNKEEVNNFLLVPSNKMLANCMTKKGASSKELLDAIRNGYLQDPLQQ